MRYNTGNPVEPDGSSDPRDLFDNAGNIDLAANSEAQTWIDRKGKTRKSLAGMEADFLLLLASSGFELPAIPYGPGIVVDRPTQLISYGDGLYSVKATESFPVTLTGVWGDDEAILIVRSDAALRTELYAYLKSDSARVVDSVSSLKALNSSKNQRATVLGYYAKGDGGGGVYYADLTDTTTADNGGTVIVGNDGARWKLASPSRPDIRQWGADGAGAANSAPAIQAALSAGGTVSARDGIYSVGSMVVVSYIGTTFPEVAYPSKRQSLIGDSTANTIFKLTAAGANTACFKLEGTNPPGVGGGIGQGIHAQDKFGGFTVYPVNRNKQGVGIWMLNRAYTRLDDFATESLNIGLELDGTLSSKFNNITLKNGNIGLLLNATALSLPNANTFTGMVLSGNSKAGLVGNSIGGGNVIIGGSIENNGTQGDSSCGGLLGNLNGSNGTACLSIYGTYFEGNAGSADIQLDNISSLPVTVLIANSTFNRVSAEHFTTSNIVITSSGGGPVKLVLMGCSFLSAGNYQPSGARPFIQIGSKVEVIGWDTCNYNESVSVSPALNNSSSAIQSGSVAANADMVSCPPGVTITLVGPGVYDVTNNGGWSSSVEGYNVIVMPTEDVSGLKLAFCVKTSASNFRCAFRINDATNYANCPFTFMVARTR